MVSQTIYYIMKNNNTLKKIYKNKYTEESCIYAYICLDVVQYMREIYNKTYVYMYACMYILKKINMKSIPII